MKTKKVPLADVLWDAANVYLSPRHLPLGIKGSSFEFSCHAFNRARHGDTRALNEGCAFLDSLGLKFIYRYCAAWDESKGHDLQGIRYMWLLLAMHVAEDEGIVIEVES